jgi:CHAT domain-containing protein
MLPASAKRSIHWFWQPSVEAFADPVPSGNSNPEPVSSTAWSRLPGARREIDGIADAIGGRAALYYGSAAPKARLLHESDAPVLHFATHAFVDLDNPDLSYILLAPASSAQRYDYLF